MKRTNPPTSPTVDKWEGHGGPLKYLLATLSPKQLEASKIIVDFEVTRAVQEAKAEEAEKFGAFLHKLAWSDKEIQDAWDWVEITPLRLKKDFKLQSTLNTKEVK